MAKDTYCEWVGPVLEDLCRFLDEADQPEIARDIQDVLDRYSDTLRARGHDPRERLSSELGHDTPTVVPLNLYRQGRSGTL